MLKSGFVFNLLLCLVIHATFSQDQDSASVENKPAQTEIKFEDDRLLNGIRFGTDISGPVYGLLVNNDKFKLYNRYELTADLGIKRFFIVADFGTGTFERNYTDSFPTRSFYKSDGRYLRIGGDYRISKSAKSFLFFGGRLGTAFFTESARITTFPREINGVEVIEGTTTPIEIDRKLVANWFELTTGIKVEIWKNFYLGYNFRFKFLIPSKAIKSEEPLDIPGFGTANRISSLGFSFNVMYRFPFGKDPVIPLKGR